MKAIVICLLLVLGAGFVMAAKSEINMPVELAQAEEFVVEWEITEVDTADFEEMVLFIDEDDFDFRSYESEYQNIVSYMMEGGRHRFDFFLPDEPDIKLDVRFKANNMGTHKMEFEVEHETFQWQDVREIQVGEPAPIIEPCEDALKPCPCGETIITHKCVSGEEVPTGNKCPACDREDDNDEETNDNEPETEPTGPEEEGTNTTIPTETEPEEQPTVTPGDDCSEDFVVDCWDQTQIIQSFCVDGKYVETNKECPEKVTEAPVVEGKPVEEEVTVPANRIENRDRAWTISIALIIIVGIILYVRKRKREEAEGLARQVEQYKRIQQEEDARQQQEHNPFDEGRYQ